ncbi:MAG: hypothetical protein GY847_12955 [Proteobacteria bacterium]|nr:hypothetical protein [Pseudomonadota bacterium]
MKIKIKAKTFSRAAALAVTLFATSSAAQFFNSPGKSDNKAEKQAKPEVKKAKPEVKKAKPAPQAARKAKPKKSSASTSDGVIQMLEEIKNNQESLQKEINALKAPGGEDAQSKPVLTAEQEASKAKLEAELADVQTQLDSLQKAIDGGLDPAAVKDSKTALEQRELELNKSIAAIQPIAPASPQSVEEQLVQEVKALKEEVAKLAEPASDDESSEPEAAEAAEEDTSIGLDIEFGLASAYVFRGLNVFQSSSQQDQHFMFAPGLSWAVGDSGVSLGYWAAYQINGGNEEDIVAGALGHEQDLIVGWGADLTDRTSVALGLVYYFYPFADADDAGCKNPSFLEPAAGIALSGWADWGLDLAYFAGLQEAVQDFSYFYINPSVSKGVELSSALETSIGLGFGYKIFKSGADEMASNMFDLSLDWDLSIQVTDIFSLSPGVHLAWTNLEDEMLEPENEGDDPIKDKKRAGEEYAVFFTLTSGLGF